MSQAAASEKSAGKVLADKIGAFPRIKDTDALPARRLSAFARIMSVVAAVEGCAIIALSFAVAGLVPLQKVVPMVVTANQKGDEIVHINPVTLASPTSDYLTEISLRDYIEKRYSVIGDDNVQATQWAPGGTVQLVSSPEVYQDFISKAKPLYEQIKAQGMTRSVRIDRVSKLGEDTWQVEYVTTDHPMENPNSPAGVNQTHAWVATMQIAFEPKNVTYNDRLMNPLGLTVLKLNEAQRD